MSVQRVAEGVMRVYAGSTASYVLRDDTGILLVDAGLPSMWEGTYRAIRELGGAPADVRALVLTHAHFDHVGFARRVAERGVPVLVHAADSELAAHPYRYRHARPRSWYALRHPAHLRHLAGMVGAGALRVRGVEAGAGLVDGQVLDLPGSPHVLHVPGHTDGHCVFHVPGRELLFTGDALVSLDPYTGRTGPRVVARAGTRDAAAALKSLDRLPQGRMRVLPGHGDPWDGDVAVAVSQARDAGVA
jgi:glyoxylase-like metal-dependent hydrolase (beta-lactamase superfamily II)